MISLIGRSPHTVDHRLVLRPRATLVEPVAEEVPGQRGFAAARGSYDEPHAPRMQRPRLCTHHAPRDVFLTRSVRSTFTPDLVGNLHVEALRGPLGKRHVEQACHLLDAEGIEDRTRNRHVDGWHGWAQGWVWMTNNFHTCRAPSRSDDTMVAVGFNPRKTYSRRNVRRVATPDYSIVATRRARWRRIATVG